MVKKVLANIYLYVLLAVLYAPIILIIVFSFFNTSLFSFSNGFSFEAYKLIFTDDKAPFLLSALKNTFVIAIVSSFIATILGSLSAIGIYCLKPKARRVVEGVNQLPIINSEIVMAVSWMIFFVTFGFPAGYFRLIVAHVAFCTPYVILSVLPKLQSMDPNVYEAALDLGANPVKAMFKVMIPILTPSILSGFMMAFTLSLDDFIITQINKGAATGINTLSTFIYSDARVQGLSPFWFAIFSIIFVVVLTTVLVVNVVKNRKPKTQIQKGEAMKNEK